MDEHRLFEKFLTECQDGDVGLWSIIWEVRYALNDGNNPIKEEDNSDPVEVRRITMNIVRGLLASNRVSAGYYLPDASGLAIWTQPLEEIMSRIELEWHNLGHEPNIGEIVLFVGKR